jgi:chemotaxis protein MotB
MADTIKAVPNKISISGHTDAKPYTGTGDFGNWELSANRANAARRALVAGSYPDAGGAGGGLCLVGAVRPQNPFNPVNRRIDIVVLTKKAQRHRRLAGGRRGQASRRRSERRRSGDAGRSERVAGRPATGAGPRVARALNLFDDGTETGRARGCGASAVLRQPLHRPRAEAVTDKKADSDVGFFVAIGFRNRVESGFSVVHGTDRRCAYRYR